MDATSQCLRLTTKKKNSNMLDTVNIRQTLIRTRYIGLQLDGSQSALNVHIL